MSLGDQGLIVSHLQFACNALLNGEASTKNLWAMKTITRSFNLVSSLRVNFAKSSLIGVNFSEEFLTMDARFLNCKRESLPFKYLKLPVGENPRKAFT